MIGLLDFRSRHFGQTIDKLVISIQSIILAKIHNLQSHQIRILVKILFRLSVSFAQEKHINLISHTMAHTTLGNLRATERVNLEIDLMARYAERMLGDLPQAPHAS